MDDTQITAMLVQVKDDASFGAAIKPWVHDAMSLDHLGLFADNASPLPVLRLVFALASEESAVILAGQERLRPTDAATAAAPQERSAYTCYDVWCAGATAATFPAVQDSKNAYGKLLLRARETKDRYASHHRFSDWMSGHATEEISAGREEARRRMNPGASSRPAHYENYTGRPPSSCER